LTYTGAWKTAGGVVSDFFDGLADHAALGCFIVAALGCGYTLFSAWAVRRFRFAASKPLEVAPSVTILKPLKGAEPGLYDNLAQFCAQDYPGALQIVFGVQDSSDPAIGIVERLKASFPAVDLELVVNGRSHGLNHKVSNLINMAASIRHDVVVVSDSDIVVEGGYLKRIVAELGDPAVGAVTCLYSGAPTAGGWAQLQAASIDYHFLPSVLVGVGIGAAEPCFGSTVALRADTLAKIGGFEAVVDQLADDYAIGDLVRRLGLKVTLAPFTVAHVCAEQSGHSLFRHELRWMRTVRFINWVGFAGSAVTYPLPFALLALAFSGFGSLGVAMVLAALACRVLLQIQVDTTFGIRRNTLWTLPVGDVLSFVVFVVSFFGNAVDWRARRYNVRADGSLAHAVEIEG
jgi:ceramide glucosyltransferase